jgi:hypothetical protein
VDVLGHVLVQHRDGLGVIGIPGSAGNFAVLDPGELVVLLPEIGLDDLGCGEELENRRVALCQAAFCECLRRLEQQTSRAEARRSNRGAALQQEGPAAGQMLRLFVRFHDLLLPEFASPASIGFRGFPAIAANGQSRPPVALNSPYRLAGMSA